MVNQNHQTLPFRSLSGTWTPKDKKNNNNCIQNVWTGGWGWDQTSHWSPLDTVTMNRKSAVVS